MSTLAVATIKSVSSAAPVFQNTSGTEIGQLVKMWINFNGTGTIAIQDSLNVTSITDDGTGLYTITFSSAFSNTNYCILTGQAAKITDDTDNRYISRCLDRSTSNMQVSHDFVENGTSNRADSNFMYFAILA